MTPGSSTSDDEGDGDGTLGRVKPAVEVLS